MITRPQGKRGGWSGQAHGRSWEWTTGLVTLLACARVGPLQAATVQELPELLQQGRLAEASQQAARFLSSAPLESRRDSIDVFVATKVLVAAEVRQSRFDDPGLLERSDHLTLLSTILYGPRSAPLADAHQYAGLINRSRGDAAAALEHFRAALSIIDSHHPPNYAARASVLHNLAEIRFEEGNYRQAKREFELELEALTAAGRDDIQVGIARVDLNEARIATRDTAGLTADYELARRSFARHEGPASPRIADTFYREGHRRFQEGDTTRAAYALDQAISILSRPAQPAVPLADCLLDRARVHLLSGETDSAITRSVRARTLYARHVGASALPVAECLMAIGDAYRAAYQQDEASRHYLEALRIYDTPARPDAAALVNCLRTLASHSLDLARLDEALRFARRALILSPDVWGGRSTETAIARLGYAAALRGAQKPDSARAHYELAGADLRATVGEASPLLAEPYLRLGALARERGDLARARAGADQALALLTQAYGTDDPRLYECHHELGIVKRQLGDARGSRAELERALHLASRGGRGAEAEAAILSSLALLERSLGNAALAEASFQRALEKVGQARSAEHPQFAQVLRNLASLANADGRWSEATGLYNRALAILEPVLGADHPDVAATRLGLGNSLKAGGDPAGAHAQYEQAISIHRDALGPEAPPLALDYHNLAALLLEEGDLAAAMEYAEQAERLGRDHFRLIARGVAEREALHFATHRVRGTDIILTAAGRRGTRQDWERAWDLVIRSRASVLEEIASRRSFATASRNPEVAALAGRLAEASNHLAYLAVRGRSPLETLPEFKQKLAAARLEKEAAERALALRSTDFHEGIERGDVGLHDVLAALPERSVLVAWVRYERLEAVASNDAPRSSGGEMSYAAFVVDSGTRDVRLIPLGPANVIEELVARWREQAGLNPSRQPERTRAEREYDEAGRALRRAVWDPVASATAEADRVFLVPDGALCLVNFDVLPTDDERFLVEVSPLFVTRSTERSLTEADRVEPRGTGLLSAGAPDYASLPITPPGDELRSAESTIPCGQFKALMFAPLPGTSREIEAVVRLWSTSGEGRADQLVGADATERRFRERAAGRRVLHVATHGFFLGAECAGRQQSSGAAAPDELTVAGLVAESPLLLSGLAFGGANRRAEALGSTDDGILTAEEIAGLDLHGVELAVLSACGTGLGQVEAGEGVIGLRRAFRVAGVQSLIMTLWSVEDEATVAWVRELFAETLRDGMNAAHAARQASLRIIRDRRETGRTDHPFFWGAFIATSG